ncbi:MAG: hypothetical protein P8Y68_18780 [Anaerolineales bacterium]
MASKKKRKLIVILLVSAITGISCQLSNPISGVGRAIENIFRSIARSINF